jgi:hypothetical protein
MKKLLLFAVVISGVALTSCTKKVDCHCEAASLLTFEVTEFEKEYKGTCDELTVEENKNLTSVTICEEH